MRRGWKRLAPAALRRLAAPAGEQEIDAVEAVLGVVLPPDFRASPGIHNGTRPDLRWQWPSPVPLECLCDTGEIAGWTRNWRHNAMTLDEVPDDWDANGPVRPVAGSAGHVLVRVDVECGLWDVLAPSWTRLLIRYAEDLERYAAAPDRSRLVINPDHGPQCEWGRPGGPG